MDINQLRTTLIRGCALADIDIHSHMVEQLLKYAQLIETANQQMNLTSITSVEEFAIKHFVDCLLLQKIGFDFHSPGIDIGTGAGFPGIVIAACFSNAPITLLDSLEKRIKFLLQVKEELQLENVRCVHARAETLAHDRQYREKFNWAVARAVAPLPVLLEYCTPYVKVNGHFIAMKGSNAEAEIAAAERASEILNIRIEEKYHFKLPFEMGERTIVKFRKISSTPPQYPRKAGVPAKKPL